MKTPNCAIVSPSPQPDRNSGAWGSLSLQVSDAWLKEQPQCRQAARRQNEFL